MDLKSSQSGVYAKVNLDFMDRRETLEQLINSGEEGISNNDAWYMCRYNAGDYYIILETDFVSPEYPTHPLFVVTSSNRVNRIFDVEEQISQLHNTLAMVTSKYYGIKDDFLYYEYLILNDQAYDAKQRTFIKRPIMEVHPIEPDYASDIEEILCTLSMGSEFTLASYLRTHIFNFAQYIIAGLCEDVNTKRFKESFALYKYFVEGMMTSVTVTDKEHEDMIKAIKSYFTNHVNLDYIKHKYDFMHNLIYHPSRKDKLWLTEVHLNNLIKERFGKEIHAPLGFEFTFDKKYYRLFTALSQRFFKKNNKSPTVDDIITYFNNKKYSNCKIGVNTLEYTVQELNNIIELKLKAIQEILSMNLMEKVKYLEYNDDAIPISDIMKKASTPEIGDIVFYPDMRAAIYFSESNSDNEPANEFNENTSITVKIKYERILGVVKSEYLKSNAFRMTRPNLYRYCYHLCRLCIKKIIS